MYGTCTNDCSNIGSVAGSDPNADAICPSYTFVDKCNTTNYYLDNKYTKCVINKNLPSNIINHPIFMRTV